MFLKLNYSKNEAEFYYVDQENGKKIRDDRHIRVKSQKDDLLVFQMVTKMPR